MGEHSVTALLEPCQPVRGITEIGFPVLLELYQLQYHKELPFSHPVESVACSPTGTPVTQVLKSTCQHPLKSTCKPNSVVFDLSGCLEPLREACLTFSSLLVLCEHSSSFASQRHKFSDRHLVRGKDLYKLQVPLWGPCKKLFH